MDGKYDFGGDTVVGGENAEAFRRGADKKQVVAAEPIPLLTPAEFLSEAKALLGNDPDAASDFNVAMAYSYLKDGIPKTAPEYQEAQILIPKIEARAKRWAENNRERDTRGK